MIMNILFYGLLIEAVTSFASWAIAIKTSTDSILDISNKGYLVDWEKLNENKVPNLNVDFGLDFKKIFCPGYNLYYTTKAYIKNKRNPLIENPNFKPILRKMTDEEQKEYKSLENILAKAEFVTVYRETPKTNNIYVETPEVQNKQVDLETKKINNEIYANNNDLLIDKVNDEEYPKLSMKK